MDFVNLMQAGVIREEGNVIEDCLYHIDIVSYRLPVCVPVGGREGQSHHQANGPGGTAKQAEQTRKQPSSLAYLRVSALSSSSDFPL